MLVSLGELGDGSVAAQRAAFACDVGPVGDSDGITLRDAAASPWSSAEDMGRKLSRAQALVHPLKAWAFDVMDEAFVLDPSVRGFLTRARCGDASQALERSYHAPDAAFSLPPEEETRAVLRRNLAVLDGSRFFVRCLLTIRVEHYGPWSIGLWVEVSKRDYEKIVAAWDDPVRYPKLEFSGSVANDVLHDLALPVPSGVMVELAVPDPDTPPQVSASRDEGVAKLLVQNWPRGEFERYAVARGFL